jgi:hypothetical protein
MRSRQPVVHDPLDSFVPVAAVAAAAFALLIVFLGRW